MVIIRHKTSHKIPENALSDLVSLTSKIPGGAEWDFAVWNHGRLSKFELSAHPNLSRFLGEVWRKLNSEGYAVIDLSPLLNVFQAETAAAATTLVLSGFGKPLKVFQSHPHWKRLEADLNRPVDKSSGIGQQPLHQDFVNAENPPDFVALLCLQQDPFGGGASLVASLDDLENSLDFKTLDILVSPIFSDGMVVNLAGIGRDINPFPVISFSDRWKYRFTGNLMKSAPHNEALAALLAVSKELESRVVSFTLRRGELLIMDQQRIVHGRGALGSGQEKIIQPDRRLLLQSYLRREERDLDLF